MRSVKRTNRILITVHATRVCAICVVTYTRLRLSVSDASD